jgi:hypothetical protein
MVGRRPWAAWTWSLHLPLFGHFQTIIALLLVGVNSSFFHPINWFMNASIDKIKYVHRGGRDLLTLGSALALGLAFWPITAYVLLESGWQLLHGTFARGAGRSVVTEGVCTDNNWCSAQQYCRINDFRNFRKYYIKRQPKNSWPIVKVTSHV